MGKKRKVEEEEASAVVAEDKAAKKKAKKEKKAAKKAAKAAEAVVAAEAAAAAEAEKTASAKKEKKKKKKKDKKEKKAKKAKKKAKVEESADSDSKKESGNDSTEEGNTEEAAAPAAAPITPVKSESSAENPEAIKRVFVGNLAWAVDEDCIRKFAEPGVIQDIHWTTDRETGKFMGRGFLEFETAAMATTFIEKDGQMLLERDIRISLARPREDRKGGQSGGRTPRPLSEKPEGCTTVFLGNLSFNIDDPDIHKFCKDKNIPEPSSIRWLTDRETGAFRGCGFIEFSDPTAVDKMVEQNGTMLLNRAMRVDYAAGRKNTPGKGGGGGGRTPKPLGEKPDGCTTCFLGNLSFDIEDDDIHAKAKEVGAGEVKNIRWLTDRESGEFKGCGFVEFHETDGVDKFVTLNGKDLKGRSMRVDFAKPRPPREY